MRFFDTQAALAKIRNEDAPPATTATFATNHPLATRKVAEVAEVAATRLRNPDFDDALDVAEERAAIIEFDGGLSHAEAEALALRQHGADILAALNRDDLSTDNLSFALLRRLKKEARDD